MKKKVRREKESQTERSCFEGEQQSAGVSKTPAGRGPGVYLLELFFPSRRKAGEVTY